MKKMRSSRRSVEEWNVSEGWNATGVFEEWSSLNQGQSKRGKGDVRERRDLLVIWAPAGRRDPNQHFDLQAAFWYETRYLLKYTSSEPMERVA